PPWHGSSCSSSPSSPPSCSRHPGTGCTTLTKETTGNGEPYVRRHDVVTSRRPCTPHRWRADHGLPAAVDGGSLAEVTGRDLRFGRVVPDDVPLGQLHHGLGLADARVRPVLPELPDHLPGLRRGQ